MYELGTVLKCLIRAYIQFYVGTRWRISLGVSLNHNIVVKRKRNAGKLADLCKHKLLLSVLIRGCTIAGPISDDTFYSKDQVTYGRHKSWFDLSL